MARGNLTELKVVLLSPSGLDAERRAAYESAEQANRQLEDTGSSFRYQMRGWEDIVPTIGGKHPQEEINAELLNNFEVAVGIMWDRFGTRTPTHESGTEQEFEKILELVRPAPSNKKFIFFFCERPFYHDGKRDWQQFSKVISFKRKVKNLGIIGTFSETAILREKLTKYLVEIAHKLQEPPQIVLASAEQGANKRFLLFQGGYVKVEHDDLLEPQDLTLEAWIFPLSIGEPNGCIIRKAEPMQPGYILRWRQMNEKEVHLRLGRIGSVVAARGPHYRDLLCKWTHLAGTFDSQSRRASLFVDGHLKGTGFADSGEMHYSKSVLSIGGSPVADGEGFFGAIRAVRISRRVIYLQDFEPEDEPRKQDDTVFLMPLTEGEGTTVGDVAGNRKGVIEGARWIDIQELTALAATLGGK